MEPVKEKIPDQINTQEKTTERKEWITTALSIFEDLSSTFSMTYTELLTKVETLHTGIKQRLTTKNPESAEKLSLNQEKVKELYEQLKKSKDNLLNVAVNSDVFKAMIPVQQKAEEKMNDMYRFYYDRIVPYIEQGYGKVNLTEPAKAWLTKGLVTTLSEKEQKNMQAKFAAIPDEVCKPLMTERMMIGQEVLETLNLEEMDLLMTGMNNPKVFRILGKYYELCEQAKTQQEDYSNEFRESIAQGLPICREKMEKAIS